MFAIVAVSDTIANMSEPPAAAARLRFAIVAVSDTIANMRGSAARPVRPKRSVPRRFAPVAEHLPARPRLR
jgi:hypothetical protein